MDNDVKSVIVKLPHKTRPRGDDILHGYQYNTRYEISAIRDHYRDNRLGARPQASGTILGIISPQLVALGAAVLILDNTALLLALGFDFLQLQL